MAYVAARDLRNDTAGVLRRVREGEDVTITVYGQPVARVVPISGSREWFARDDLAALLMDSQADPGLRAELVELAGETTDDLDDPW